jgi:hypothetical protein
MYVSDFRRTKEFRMFRVLRSQPQRFPETRLSIGAADMTPEREMTQP